MRKPGKVDGAVRSRKAAHREGVKFQKRWTQNSERRESKITVPSTTSKELELPSRGSFSMNTGIVPGYYC